MNAWTAIFRAGRHTDSAGVEREISTADLDAMVAAYDPAEHEAPLVIGHPQTDHPAYGWVEALKRSGDKLLARFKEVPDALKETVAAGRYKKVSVALYPDGRLRHVGLLGAVPPAVKGLGNVNFEAGLEWSAYQFAEEEPNMDKVEQLQAEVAELKAKNAQAEQEAAAAKTAQAAAEGKAQAAETARAAAEQRFAEKEAQAAKAARENRFNELVKLGKAAPGDKPVVMAIAGSLAASEFTFAEGGEERKVAGEEAYWKMLEGRGCHKLLGEFAEEPQGQEDDIPNAAVCAAKF
ncbi:MAG: hypothetical protein KQJ78_11065 [Deltaproteobacteria bacterium]|nr:hypothetical protein [Deltaproteobacteria bacterium]